MRQPEGREVVIVEAVRTPIGRGHKEKGYYKDTHPNTLLAKTYTEVIERAGIDAAEASSREVVIEHWPRVLKACDGPVLPSTGAHQSWPLRTNTTRSPRGETAGE